MAERKSCFRPSWAAQPRLCGLWRIQFHLFSQQKDSVTNPTPDQHYGFVSKQPENAFTLHTKPKNAFSLSDESHLSQRQQLMRHSTESFYSNHRALINISIFLKANSFHSNTETEAECDFGRVLLQIFMQSLFCFGFFWTKWDLTWAAPSLCNGFIAIQK